MLPSLRRPLSAQSSSSSAYACTSALSTLTPSSPRTTTHTITSSTPIRCRRTHLRLPLDAAFYAQMDSFHLTQDYVGGLLERGIRVLIYVGTYNYSCNWVGNERWTLALKWSG
ncbi:hypothetical protein B0H19DRAFT_1270428 [Mycena capillaripes]|nr:hypothetical protein B0H19DRAFT_1270428 [Mycena capillaripes]